MEFKRAVVKVWFADRSFGFAKVSDHDVYIRGNVQTCKHFPFFFRLKKGQVVYLREEEAAKGPRATYMKCEACVRAEEEKKIRSKYSWKMQKAYFGDGFLKTGAKLPEGWRSDKSGPVDKDGNSLKDWELPSHCYVNSNAELVIRASRWAYDGGSDWDGGDSPFGTHYGLSGFGGGGSRKGVGWHVREYDAAVVSPFDVEIEEDHPDAEVLKKIRELYREMLEQLRK